MAFPKFFASFKALVDHAPVLTAYNLLENKAGYVNTGAWSTKALK